MAATPDGWTHADELEMDAHRAVQARDFPAVGQALARLAVVDPERASDVRIVLKAAIILGRRRHDAEAT